MLDGKTSEKEGEKKRKKEGKEVRIMISNDRYGEKIPKHSKQPFALTPTQWFMIRVILLPKGTTTKQVISFR